MKSLMQFQPETVIAIIGPDFFSYTKAICDEIISRGYKCNYYDERHSNTIFSKILYRLKLGFIITVQRDRHLNYLIEEILANKTTDVFLINVEVVSVDFVALLKKFGLRVHIYMWDSAKNKNAFLELLPLLNGRSSFEPSDCEVYGLTYIPLFAESVFISTNVVRKRENSLVFLGTLHSHRTLLLQKIENLLKGSEVKVRKLLYYHSRLLFLLKCIINPSAISYIPEMRTNGFNKSEIAAAYLNSCAVLDIHHPGQVGLTSRTFEALRAGAYLITLNKTAHTLPSELHSRIILLDNVDQINCQLARIYRDLPPLSPSMDYFLSLQRFVDNLLHVGGLDLRLTDIL
jgi:hypothetical protein